MFDDLLQFVVVLGVMTGLVAVLGKWLTHVFVSPSHGAPERWTYSLLGIDPAEVMSWKRYGMVLLLSNAAMMILGYFLLRIQDYLPFDSLQRAAQGPDLAFNTAASFITNTNWQSYSGETTMGYLAQMAGLAVQNFVSAAVGMAVA